MQWHLEVEWVLAPGSVQRDTQKWNNDKGIREKPGYPEWMEQVLFEISVIQIQHNLWSENMMLTEPELTCTCVNYFQKVTLKTQIFSTACISLIFSLLMSLVEDEGKNMQWGQRLKKQISRKSIYVQMEWWVYEILSEQHLSKYQVLNNCLTRFSSQAI